MAVQISFRIPFSDPALAAGLIAGGFFSLAIAKSSNGNAFSTCLSYRRIRRGFVLRTATPKMSRRRGCAARAFLPGPISCRTPLSRSWMPMCG